MKRPASEQPETSPPPRSRRRLSSQPRAQTRNLEETPHDSLVADDEDMSPPIAKPREVQNIIQVKYTSPSPFAINNKIGEEFQHYLNGKGTISRSESGDDVVVMDRTTRPLPRLKIIPPKDPSLMDVQEWMDWTLDTPPTSPEGLRAPPCSPSGQEMDNIEKEEDFPHLNRKWGEAEQQNGPIVDISKLPPEPDEPILDPDLFWPEHRPPTPPFYAQHFDPIDAKILQADKDSLGSAVRNANTYVKKVKILPQDPKAKKKTKTKKPWSFTDCEEYPRGETPPIELMLDKDEGSPIVSLVILPPEPSVKNDSEFSEEEEEAEVMRDPGIAVALSVDTDSAGRYVCKWGDCNKTFARNDHLGRHVKVSHLRVRKHRCEPCQMAFIGVKGLRNHEKTHVIPKPFTREATNEEDNGMGEDDPDHPATEDQSTTSLLALVSRAPTIGGLEIEPEDEGDPFFD